MTALAPLHARQDISFEQVQNPLLTDAQFIHLQASSPDDPAVGKIIAAINQQTYCGGFHRFGGDPHQIMAAAKFRRCYDAAQIGGGRAVDPTREPVDGGGIDPEAVFRIGADARAELDKAWERLGKIMYRRFVFVVVAGNGPTAYYRWITGQKQPSAKQVSRAKVEVRRIANNLAELWGFSTKAR